MTESQAIVIQKLIREHGPMPIDFIRQATGFSAGAIRQTARRSELLAFSADDIVSLANNEPPPKISDPLALDIWFAVRDGPRRPERLAAQLGHGEQSVLESVEESNHLRIDADGNVDHVPRCSPMVL